MDFISILIILHFLDSEFRDVGKINSMTLPQFLSLRACSEVYLEHSGKSTYDGAFFQK